MITISWVSPNSSCEADASGSSNTPVPLHVAEKRRSCALIVAVQLGIDPASALADPTTRRARATYCCPAGLPSCPIAAFCSRCSGRSSARMRRARRARRILLLDGAGSRCGSQALRPIAAERSGCYRRRCAPRQTREALDKLAYPTAQPAHANAPFQDLAATLTRRYGRAFREHKG